MAAGIAAYCIKWQPSADFDVIGILYLMQNILPLALLGLSIFLGVGAAYCWFRAIQASAREV